MPESEDTPHVWPTASESSSRQARRPVSFDIKDYTHLPIFKYKYLQRNFSCLQLPFSGHLHLPHSPQTLLFPKPTPATDSGVVFSLSFLRSFHFFFFSFNLVVFGDFLSLPRLMGARCFFGGGKDSEIHSFLYLIFDLKRIVREYRRLKKKTAGDKPSSHQKGHH